MSDKRSVEFLKELYRQHKQQQDADAIALPFVPESLPGITKEEKFCVQEMQRDDTLFISAIDAEKVARR